MEIPRPDLASRFALGVVGKVQSSVFVLGAPIMSIAIEPRTSITPEQFLELPDRKRFELVDGELVEQDVSALSSLIAAEIVGLLREFARPARLAWVFGADGGYRCFRGGLTVRIPDVSVVLRERLPVESIGEGWLTIAPDIAVEVVSPNDRFNDVEGKIVDYLAAGTRLVWVVNPERRWVSVHRNNGTTNRLLEGDELTGEEVLPGFRVRVGDLFPAPAAGPA
jgi:Uma2 family endonuclease